MKYRVLEKNNRFYPQFKNGIKTFWTWTKFLKYNSESNYVYVVYDNLDDASNFCKKHKKENELIIWELSDNGGYFLSKKNKF